MNDDGFENYKGILTRFIKPSGYSKAYYNWVNEIRSHGNVYWSYSGIESSSLMVLVIGADALWLLATLFLIFDYQGSIGAFIKITAIAFFAELIYKSFHGKYAFLSEGYQIAGYDVEEDYYPNGRKSRIGCWGWFGIVLGIFILISSITTSIEEKELQEAQVQEEIKQEEREQERQARLEEEKRIEDETKYKLTDDMVNNQAGDSVDLYGVELTVSEPFETPLDDDVEGLTDKEKYERERTKVVSFDITIENNSDVEVQFEHFYFDLIKESYRYPGAQPGNTYDRNYSSSKEMESYYGRDDILPTDVIPPGETVTGTISYEIMKSDTYGQSPDAIANGAGDYSLIVDVGNLPFLHSFEENRIGFALEIGEDYYYDKLIFELE